MENKIKHIFFDLDHTLWDFQANSDASYAEIFTRRNLDLDFEKFKDIYNPINALYWKKYRTEAVSKQELRYGRLKDTFDAMEMVVSDGDIDEIADEYIETLPKYNKLFEGAIEVLDYLKNKGYQMHMITNGFKEVQWKKCVNSEIDSYFQCFVTSESVGVQKPNPKVFHYAMKHAGAAPEESVMIGDNQEADIEGALNCKMKAIFCNFDNQILSQNCVEVKSLTEIKNHL